MNVALILITTLLAVQQTSTAKLPELLQKFKKAMRALRVKWKIMMKIVRLNEILICINKLRYFQQLDGFQNIAQKLILTAQLPKSAVKSR